jgi:hypothetical protein
MHLNDDVDNRQAMQKGPPFHRGFKFIVKNDGTTAAVVVEGHNIYDCARFKLTATAIEVFDRNDKLRFKATPTLNDEGECRLKIDGQERELWHLRKMALEPLFFPPD